jgi:hypothetical protein
MGSVRVARNAVSFDTVAAKSAAGSPVSSRTKTEVSIP